MKFGNGIISNTVAFNIVVHCHDYLSSELLAALYILYLQTMIVCGDVLYSTKCCPALPKVWVLALLRSPCIKYFRMSYIVRDRSMTHSFQR